MATCSIAMMVWMWIAAAQVPSGPLGIVCFAQERAATAADVPQTPGEVAAADIGGGRALVSWQARGDDEESFRVERNPPFREGPLEIPPGVTSFTDECGDGDFAYRVQTLGRLHASAFSPWVEVVVSSRGAAALAPFPGERAGALAGQDSQILRGVTIGADGWAELRPSAGTRIVYVSSSRGSDRNDGFSESSPKRTIEAGYGALRDGYADWLLLKSGDVWEEGQLWWSKSGRSPEERMAVGVYGGTARAVWKTGSASAIHGNPRDGQVNANLIFRDLHLVAHQNDGAGSGAGFMLMNGWRDVLIENCMVERYRVNMIFQAHAADVRQRNIVVRRCVIVDARSAESHAQGIFADGVDGLMLEQNVLDRNGWGPGAPTANMYRHNAYIQTRLGTDKGCTHVVLKGNTTARASASGFMTRVGGVVEGNLFLQNPIGLSLGSSAELPVRGVVRGNVFLDSRDIAPGEPRGHGIWLTNPRGVEVVENILAHQRSGSTNIVAINVDGRYENVVLRGNIVYDWTHHSGAGGAGLMWHGTPLGGMRIEGNDFQQVRGGFVVGHEAPLTEGFAYSANRYYNPRKGRDEFWRGMTYEQWVSRTGEDDSSFTRCEYPDADRTIDHYMRNLGLSGGLDEFLNHARRQARDNWRPEFTAGAVIQYVREGFGIGNSEHAVSPR